MVKTLLNFLKFCSKLLLGLQLNSSKLYIFHLFYQLDKCFPRFFFFLLSNSFLFIVFFLSNSFLFLVFFLSSSFLFLFKFIGLFFVICSSCIHQITGNSASDTKLICFTLVLLSSNFLLSCLYTYVN